MQNLVQGFKNVDLTDDVEFLFHILDTADQIESFQLCKQRMLELLQVKAGDHILDVGCGLGHEVRRLAQIVGSSGRVVGFDYSEVMLKEARKRTEGLNLPIEYYQGDAQALNFPDNSFAGCRSERVFSYLSNPQAAVAEMVRVLRPGGHIVIIDFYLDGTVVDSRDQNLTRRIIHYLSDSFPNGTIGAKLPAIFRDSGLDEITIVPHTLLPTYEFFTFIYNGVLNKATDTGVISESELSWWKNELEKAHKVGKFFAAFTGFIVSGRKV